MSDNTANVLIVGIVFLSVCYLMRIAMMLDIAELEKGKNNEAYPDKSTDTPDVHPIRDL